MRTKSGIAGITADQVALKIQNFNEQYNDVKHLAHVVLEDFNLSEEFIEYVLTESLPEAAEQWVNEQIGGDEDSVTRMLDKARSWSRIWELTILLNWLLWDVPSHVLGDAESILMEDE